MDLQQFPSTPRSHLCTPKKLMNKRLPPETPECFTPVSMETPVLSTKRKISKESYDEVSNLTVAVRVRPMNRKELSNVGSAIIIRVHENELLVRSTSIGATGVGTDHLFQYDHVFWSCDKKSLNHSSQEDVFDSLGRPLLANAFQGYNACLFAYGQTGSGKSYSMMGPETEIDKENAGIIPRFCKELFLQISELPHEFTANVEVSYFEIYNEKIHDLLAPENGKSRKDRPALKVREHPVWGPYVVNLSVHVVRSYEELHSWLLLGIKNRATAATVMNEKSSRSHSIFSIELSLSEGNKDSESGRRSKISLVDLAGSERLGNSYNCEEKLKQGVSINKSLLTLGKVISALAEQRKGNQFVPYRESVLTWLLKESLGGNSHTTMLATISPSNAHSDETLSTLRYACQARSIVNRARINEDPHDRLIRELRAEVERLRALRNDYEKSSSLSNVIQIDDSNSSSNLSESEREGELNGLKQQLKIKEDQLLKAQQEWEQRFMETKERQMKELLEVEKQKEELESHVRILTKVDPNLNISPYQTNFLDELENILLSDKEDSSSHILTKIKTLFGKSNYDYEICLSPSGKRLHILDPINKSKSCCSLNEIENISDETQLLEIFKNLNWIDNNNCKKNKRLSRSEVYGPLKQIYDALNALKFVTEDDESTRLAFAKFSKSFQVFEAVLQNKLNNANNGQKTVCFRL